MATEIKHVSKTFGQTEALKSIDLSIKDGEFIAILGPSGCGKTTLLKLLAGFDSPSAGEIYIGGECVGEKHYSVPPEKRNIGMVFQSFALWPHMNVAEHIRFPLLHHRFLADDLKGNIDKRMKEVLHIVELHAFAKRMPHELSGGQKQRVALARAIAAKPALLLMDEPLSSLDAELRMEMRREIQSLHRMTGATIVYVTHDQDEALAMADRIVVMENGEIQQTGTPREIYYKPETEFVAKFVGKANLIPGEWLDEQTFKPHANSIQSFWTGVKVSPGLRARNLCPIRPEQFCLTQHEDGLKGTITNAQFQGKEIHYIVDTGSNLITIHEDSQKGPFHIGDHVYIQLKQSTLSKPLLPI
ncbi:ABC transporter ATP-binding protein [uncultured Metabacillus sp.]|uniref:ABC transporter ATP-binding protein n=1 Tax=uncultured Metabacillus sp. TaxID=2860135 RepID=UPI00262E3618|nr:ABC transporter ATP-binding protein [uncultured Metabacillus sp.]